LHLQVAAVFGTHKSTVSQELRRNCGQPCSRTKLSPAKQAEVLASLIKMEKSE
jgi:IS30 family transposase